jgi:hypothetical protein
MIINELQYHSLIKMQKMLKECHYVDMIIRINGKDEFIEADFLKQLIMSIPIYHFESSRNINDKIKPLRSI